MHTVQSLFKDLPDNVKEHHSNIIYSEDKYFYTAISRVYYLKAVNVPSCDQYVAQKQPWYLILQQQTSHQ